MMCMPTSNAELITKRKNSDNLHPSTQRYGKTTFLMNMNHLRQKKKNIGQYRRGGGRGLHPLVLGTAALSLLATALPSSAFAASMGNSHPSLSSVSPTHRDHHYLIVQQQRQRQYQRSISTTTNTMWRMSRHHPLFALRGGQTSSNKNYSVPPTPSSILFTRPINKVTVVGGTHGNEYTGIWVIKSIDKQREIYRQTMNDNNEGDASVVVDNQPSVNDHTVNIFEQYPSLEIETLLANPVAYMENKRFIDVDLNREFSVEKLRKVPQRSSSSSSSVNNNGDYDNDIEECDVRTEFCSDGRVDMAEVLASLPHGVRAREIEGLLGPKFVSSATPSTVDQPLSNHNDDDDPNTCVVIDLHTTTSNMGITLIIPEGDALMSAAASYVLHKCHSRYGEHEAQILMHALPERQDRMNLSSCGRHGFTIEVGPTPQGVLRHDVVEKTEVAMHALLEFLHLHNLELLEKKRKMSDDDDDDDDDGNEKASSLSMLLHQLHRIYPNGIVPCYRSAPAVRPGELSGKISWPNDDINPNFPKWMIHKSVQDRDFELLRVGDPLFVELDGTVVPYDGSHGDEVYLIFVNEGGYYYASSGTGIGVAVRSQFDLQTGECERVMSSLLCDVNSYY